MIDLWWMLIPAFVIWFQWRLIGKMKFIIENLMSDLDDALDSIEKETARHLSTAQTLTKTMGQYKALLNEYQALLRDFADSTKVSQPHEFIRSRIEARRDAQKKKKRVSYDKNR